MVLLGALERASPDRASPLFLLKGGVAIELRVRTGARATKDVDVVFVGEPGELLDALDAAFAEPYCDFAFRRGAPAEHGPHATRFDVRLSYQTRAWATVRLEISAPEHGADEPEYLDAISLQDFKLSGPRSIACLPLRFQIAQKLHAVSERPIDRPNDRFRDLVDLLVLRDLIDDLPALRRACESTFDFRATHAWPPPLDAPATWQAGYARLAGEVGLDIVDVDAAAAQVRVFIAAIAEAR
jgi:hypothetical protein